MEMFALFPDFRGFKHSRLKESVLTLRRAPASFSSRHQDCFEEVKRSILSNVTLAFFDMSKETILVVDASPVAVGLVLKTRRAANT